MKKKTKIVDFILPRKKGGATWLVKCEAHHWTVWAGFSPPVIGESRRCPVCPEEPKN